jgi:RNA polymerase sigma factor (sigma-70 family)
MPNARLGAVLRHIRRVALPPDTQGLTDVQLLDRFSRGREEAAFAVLMQRHSGLVWGVCRHVLRQEQDAEDAFQATFLVLARKAGTIRKREALASWLHGTALRIAMTARREQGRRRAHEAKAAPARKAVAPSESAWQEVLAALDEEVRDLPARQRAVFVLCALEGQSQAEAAAALGWKLGTVAGTLARARRHLRVRLGARGITLSAVLAGIAIAGRPARAGAPLVGRRVLKKAAHLGNRWDGAGEVQIGAAKELGVIATANWLDLRLRPPVGQQAVNARRQRGGVLHRFGGRRRRGQCHVQPNQDKAQPAHRTIPSP